MIRSLSPFVALGIVLSQPVGAQSLHTAPRGTKVTGSFEIGAAQFPLMAGDWILAGRGETQGGEATGVIRTANVYLLEVINGKISRGVFASAPLRGQGSGRGWSRNRSVCDRNNVNFNSSDRNFNPRDSRCWSVNYFITASPNNPNDPLKDLFEYLAENKLDMPVIRVVTEHWLNDTGPYLQGYYFFNPEHVGISAGPFERWDSAEWILRRISAFPDKKAFVEKAEAFGKAIQDSLERGVRGRLDLGKPVDIQLAGWPVPQAPAPVAPTSATPSDPSSRLRALQDLKSRGLISDGDFEQQRKRILDGL